MSAQQYGASKLAAKENIPEIQYRMHLPYGELIHDSVASDSGANQDCMQIGGVFVGVRTLAHPYQTTARTNGDYLNYSGQRQRLV